MHLRAPLLLVSALVLLSGCATQGKTGAAVGGGIGYIIGNERGKEDARKLSEQRRSRNHEHGNVGARYGTKWEPVDWSPKKGDSTFRSKTVEFRTNGRVITTTIFADGRSERDDATYRVSGTTLIINKPGYLANYRFRIDGRELTIDTDQVRALLRRV